MTAAPSDVAGWRSSPAGLNGQTLGKNVRLSDGGCVAERGEGGLENAVVYTDNAIPVGQVWLVTVLATSRAGSREGLTLGLKSTPPGSKGVPNYLRCGRAGQDEWYYSAQCVYHDKKSHYFPDIPSLSDLTQGQTVGLLVTAAGELHLFLNRVHHKLIARGLPVHTPLWGAADVYGICTRIKSEILSEPVGTRMRPVPHPQRQLSGGVANPMRQHQQHSSPPPHVTHNSQLPSAEPVGTRMRPVPHPQRQLSGGVANSMRQHQQHSSPPPHVTHNSRLPSANNLSPPHTADPRPVQTHSTTAASHSCGQVSGQMYDSQSVATTAASQTPPNTPPLISRPSPPALQNHSPSSSTNTPASHTVRPQPATPPTPPPSFSHVMQSLTRSGHHHVSEVDTLRQQLQRKDAEISRLRREVEEKETRSSQDRERYSTLQRHLEERLRRSEEELSRTKAEVDSRNRTIEELRAELHQIQSQSLEQQPFWQVAPQEVKVHEARVLGTGAWGKVCEGRFRGARVAVKCVHNYIVAPKTRERICREITVMAHMRHPNLVLFIAAVLDDRSGPRIVTEILDISLRFAYETGRLGHNKLRVFCDVASAMNYLHSQRDPIIHRDLSSANVLLEAMADNIWRAKVGDFGSANLVRMATTLGEGAIVYTAPEAFPTPPTSSSEKIPQTTKIDVYSYGVLLCEVTLARFPDSDHFLAMVEEVGGVWPAMYRLVQRCIKTNPRLRPSMADILNDLATLH